MSASPSMAGGNRALWSLRIPLEHLGARVYPDMFSLAQAHQAFDGSGRIANSTLQERFARTIECFMDLVEAAAREASRYEISVDGHVSFLQYERRPGMIVLVHTEVPELLRGHGLAGLLAKSALEAARAEGIRVIAKCPFVRAYIQKHHTP